MTKHDFLTRLSAELEKNQVPDVEDIVEEYEQHFAFKLADGYSEEEIAAKLGAPEQLAAQYERGGAEPRRRQGAVFTKLGLYIVDFFAGILYLVLLAWGVGMAAFSLCCAVASVCLIGGWNIAALLPSMPWLCGAILGAALLALAVLIAAGLVYYLAFLGRSRRSFGRFHRNTLAAAAGKPTHPAQADGSRLSPRATRRLRGTVKVSLVVFAACFVIGFVVCCLSAGAFQFWHVWGWFGYAV